MLDNLRNFGRSWIAKILIGFLIIAVAGFGIPSVFLDLNANTVARVGDETVTVQEFQRVYQGQLNRFAQQTGTVPTPQEALNYGIPNAALARLASDAATDGLANRLGLSASDAKLAEFVRQDPSFAGALGLFDSSEFRAMLRQSGYTEAEYLGLQRNIANRQQIGYIFDGAELPSVATDIARSYENDQRSIDYVELNPVLFEVSEQPGEEELATFFEENQARFRTVETREINLLPLTVDALADGIEVSEDEIAAEYERTASQYVASEARTVHQLALPNDEAVQAFTEGLEEGRSFASVVTETGLQTEVDELGTLTQDEIDDPELAEIAFSLDEGGYAVLEDGDEPRAIWVSAINEGGQQPLDAVRDQVERSIQESRARDMLFDVYDAIEEARAAFLPIADVANDYELEVYDVSLTQNGGELAEIEAIPPETHQTIIQSVFAADEDAQVTPAINLGSNRTAFFELEEVSPARDQTLDEVREEAIAAWQEEQTQAAMVEAAEAMVDNLRGGTDLYTIAAERGLMPQTSGNFSRTGGPTALPAELAQAAFQGGEGHADYVNMADGAVAVFEVTQVTPAPADAVSEVASALQETFPDLLFASFVEGLRQDVGIRVNEEALNRVMGIE